MVTHHRNTMLQSFFQLNFYRLHLSYFILTTLIASVIFYGSGRADDVNENNGLPLAYIDALFLCASAMTATGLNTVNLGILTAFQQSILAILIVLGNIIFVSFSVGVIRRHLFSRKLSSVLQHTEIGRQIADDVNRQEHGQATNDQHSAAMNGILEKETGDSTAGFRDPQSTHIQRRHPRTPAPLYESSVNRTRYHETGFGGLSAPWELASVRKLFIRPFKRLTQQAHGNNHSYISFNPSLDQKGRFRSLTEQQREELGGLEYRSMKLLSWILPAYLIFWITISVLILVPYSYRQNIASVVRGSQPGNLNPGWWAFFTTLSGFGDCGLSLLDSSMISLNGEYLILIVVGALILVGNTQFPVFLRLTIWFLSKIVPQTSELHQTLSFLLDHPRRCFIYLFPSTITWYLFAVQVVIDLTVWVLFMILNIGLPAVDSIPGGTRTIDGLFQALGARTSGFSIITISSLAPALQVTYLAAMYISSLPIIISLRRSNIYEEQSLGIERSDKHDDNQFKSETSYVGRHISNILVYDLWYILIAFFLICVIERNALVTGQPGFSVFSILFEVASAYGLVGLSTGVPYDNYSLCGTFHVLSKIVLLALMLRGRHRVLPLATDRAVLSPGGEMMLRMDEDYDLGQDKSVREGLREVQKDEKAVA
ncbi:MAG: hypothetical protein M1830_002029 [Pleopsidium flavum]|nr:MAG: hypothetical protein M1830_002029 [Pleopsidium flavum]